MFVCNKGNASWLDKTIDIARFSEITSKQMEMMRFNIAHQVKDVDLITIKGKVEVPRSHQKRKINKERFISPLEKRQLVMRSAGL